MKNSWLLLGLAIASATSTALAYSSPAQAETALERIARTGVLRAGTSTSAKPFAFRDGSGDLTGYSVAMLERIEQRLETELGRELELQLLPLLSDQRIPAVTGNRVDLICDASSFTWARDRQVDFSVSYGLTGTRLLVKRDQPLEDPEDLTGLRVAALPKTTNETAMRQRNAEVVLFDDRRDTYVALIQGEVDAVAADGILLEAWLSNNPLADRFAIASIAYSQEGIACMVPENNSDLLDAVNYTLTRFMQEFLDGEPEAVAVFDRWFGSESDVPLTQDLRGLAIDNMQLVIDSREAVPAEF